MRPGKLLDRAAAFLESQGGPVSTELLAREVLGLKGGDRATLDALMGPMLRGDPRFRASGSGRWVLAEPDASVGETPQPLTVWAVEPSLARVACVRIEAGRITDERVESARSPILGGGELTKVAIARLARIARGSIRFVVGPPAELRPLEPALMRALPAEDPARDVRTLPLLRLARTVLDSGAIADLETLVGVMKLGPMRLESALDRARTGAEALVRLLESQTPARTLRWEDFAALCRTTLPAFDYAGRAFDRAFLAALPAGPGTYRFFDDGGSLLYVGKAKDLRRRVGSYFSRRVGSDPRTRIWIGQVHRIAVEPRGSEVEALLEEAESIARAAPRHNVQRAVREPEAARWSGDLVLIVPSGSPDRSRAHLIHRGEIAASATLGPGARGLARLRRLLDAVFYEEPHAKTQDVSARGSLKGLQGRQRRSSRPIQGARAGEAGRAARQSDASRAIVRRWLARIEGPIPGFDPTAVPDAARAAALALEYARSLAEGEGPVIHRP